MKNHLAVITGISMLLVAAFVTYQAKDMSNVLPGNLEQLPNPSGSNTSAGNMSLGNPNTTSSNPPPASTSSSVISSTSSSSSHKDCYHVWIDGRNSCKTGREADTKTCSGNYDRCITKCASPNTPSKCNRTCFNDLLDCEDRRNKVFDLCIQGVQREYDDCLKLEP